MYNKMGMNSKKATNDKTARSTPFVLVLAKEISNDASTISPMAINDAHILSMDDID